MLGAGRRRLDVEVDERELQARLAWRPVHPPASRRGYGALFAEHLLQADQGCDFAFLERLTDVPPRVIPLGFLRGTIGGW